VDAAVPVLGDIAGLSVSIADCSSAGAMGSDGLSRELVEKGGGVTGAYTVTVVIQKACITFEFFANGRP
jgi:hypothetical protein